MPVVERSGQTRPSYCRHPCPWLGDERRSSNASHLCSINCPSKAANVACRSTSPAQLVDVASPCISYCDRVNIWRKWGWRGEYSHFGNINMRLVTLLIRWGTWCISGERWKWRVWLSDWLFGHIIRSQVCTQRFPYLVLYIGIVCLYRFVQTNRNHVIAELCYRKSTTNT